jgi:iron complex outermembrane receptor protein
MFARLELLGCVSLISILTTQHPGQAQETTPVPPVSVTAPPPGPLTDGSAAAGYRVQESTASGPIWGDLPVQDTPYSISVIPSSLIENLQAYQSENLYNIIPQITNFQPSQNRGGFSIAYIRGFAVSQYVNDAGITYDGMLAAGGTNVTLEDKERVEVLSGVNGFLYGTGSVGGNINYVLKRPTELPCRHL